jgi:hypothetical protein
LRIPVRARGGERAGASKLFLASRGLGWGVVVGRVQSMQTVRPPVVLPQCLQLAAHSLENTEAMMRRMERKRREGVEK